MALALNVSPDSTIYWNLGQIILPLGGSIFSFVNQGPSTHSSGLDWMRIKQDHIHKAAVAMPSPANGNYHHFFVMVVE